MSKISKVISNVLCGVLVIGAVAGAGTALYMGGKNNGWFDEYKKSNTEQSQPDKSENETSTMGGAIISESSNKGIKLARAMLTSAEYDEYGVSPLAETAYTLTATVDTDDVVLSQLEWSIGFVNPSSSWASGKTVSSYVTMSVSSDTYSATLSCAKAFGEQIKVTVKSKWFSEVKAECTVDYVKRVTGVTTEVVTSSTTAKGRYFMNLSQPNVINATPTYGVGTVQGVFTAGNSITISVANSKIKTYMANYIADLGVSSQFSLKDNFTVGLSEKLGLDHFITYPQNNYAYTAQYKLICNEVYDLLFGTSTTSGDFRFTIPYTYVYGSFSQNGTSTATAIQFYSNGITKYTVANTVTVSQNNLAF